VSARFLPAGDLALSIEFDAAVDDALGQRLRALEALAVAEIAEITETVPSFRALLVYYDPLRIGYEALCERLRALLPRAGHAPAPPARRVELPCCYRDPELGFELEAAAARVELPVDELIRLQTSVDYRVYFLGFAPGQPYLTGMPARIEIPRLDTPRTHTPAGSVGIGGTQCCVYSVESPGGFWVLGRTPVRLYDPAAREPVLLRPGDLLRFRAIDRVEYDRISAVVAAGIYRAVIA
jgi:KipI family sensor histidine kinase inhibitor